MSQGHRVNIVELNNQELGAVAGPGCYQREIFAAMASQDCLDRELGLTHYRVTGDSDSDRGHNRINFPTIIMYQLCVFTL